MRQAQGELRVQTRPRSLTDVTAEVRAWVARQGIGTGLLTLFVRHTTASLIVQENADPDVLADLLDAYDGLAPAAAGYRHETEGPDDMPGHIKAALAPVSLSIPVADGRPVLGMWQAIYLAEWRTAAHARTITLHLIGE